jgi:thiamine-phosphate pyrophosphorylase
MITLPRLYAILDAGCFSDVNAMFIAAEELAAGGCTLIQYRNKFGNARVMLEQARELKRRLSHPFDSPSLRSGSLREGSNAAKNAALGWGTQLERRLPSQSQNPHFSQNRGEVGHPTVEGTIKGQPPHPVAQNATRVGQPSVLLIMNDRADLCLAADFDGVHVGQEDLSPEAVRKIIGPERWLGVSTHNPEQIREADLTSADYLAIGPVFETSSKEKPDPVVGLEGVRRARELTRKPLVAIGGITRANAASVIEAGADSVAVISDLLREPRKSAEEFFRVLR